MVKDQPYQRGDGDHSLGHMYKKATGALGFRYPSSAPLDGYYFPEDGITMGLASYGDERFIDEVWKFVELEADGKYQINLNDGQMDALLARLLAANADFSTRAAVAQAFQEVLNRLLCHVIDHVLEVTGETSLCLGGGVAMNSSANGEILRRTKVKRLYVPPIPGDNGTAIGAALWTLTRDPSQPVPKYSVYGGQPWPMSAVSAAVSKLDSRYRTILASACDLIEEAASRLASGQVLAWFEGGSENGRRALGHRSILADPRTGEMRDHLNDNVKRRQPFRPFAPVVPEERASEFFEIGQPSPYMQIVFPVRKEWREKLAAITHVDGSARVQTLTRHELPRLHDLLVRFESKTGVPVLLNTSFNGKGEPIVETPLDAVAAFERMPLDGLVFEDRMVVRK
jgi:carbamoyltransferase